MTQQRSESVLLGALLAFSGGMMDAYSYLGRGGVFANAQTGNILLFGVRLSEGNFLLALQYCLPVLAFALGIALAELVRWRGRFPLHWRQTAVLLEAAILFGVAWFPPTLHLAANALTSFACGVQVQSFRKIRGNAIATTMCIGNLRSGTQNLFQSLHRHDRAALGKAALCYGVIFCFMLGAVAGRFLIEVLHLRAILCCSALLLLAFFLMFQKESG